MWLWQVLLTAAWESHLEDVGGQFEHHLTVHFNELLKGSERGRLCQSVSWTAFCTSITRPKDHGPLLIWLEHH